MIRSSAGHRGSTEYMRLNGSLVRRRPTEDDGVDSIKRGYLVLDASLGRGGIPMPKKTRSFWWHEDEKVVCTRCGVERSSMDFAPDARKRNGLQSQCNICRAELMRERRYWRKQQTPNVM